MLYVISPSFHLRIGFLLVLAVTVLSLVPGPPMSDDTFSHADKLAHGLCYAVLTVWFAVVYARGVWPVLMFSLFLLGLAIEGAQAMLPYRDASAGDVLANCLGIAFGIVAATAMTRRTD